jgi:hypothetical protein
MFGMLDYRAHKLFLILFGIPNWILIVLIFILLPIASYHLGFYLLSGYISHFTGDILQFISAVGIYWLLSIIITILALVVTKLVNFLFGLFIDVIPHDGRNQEQAMLVVWGGEKAITSLRLGIHPKEWNDDDPQRFAKLDWVSRLFFSDQIIARLTALREHYIEHPDDLFHEGKIKELLNQYDVKMGWAEKVFTSSMMRSFILQFTYLIILLLWNPSGY